MEIYSTPPKLQVNYWHAINEFDQLARLVLPEMRLRNLRAETVLVRKNKRSRNSATSARTSRMFNVEPVSLKDRDVFALHRDALLSLQRLFEDLHLYGCMPKAKVPQVVEILARFPIISAKQLAQNASVSEATAKRWLKNMSNQGLVLEKSANGQNQYVNQSLLGIIDSFW